VLCAAGNQNLCWGYWGILGDNFGSHLMVGHHVEGISPEIGIRLGRFDRESALSNFPISQSLVDKPAVSEGCFLKVPSPYMERQ
jgi:hypothetical protein